MQQRHEALDSLDDFPTPPWATRALCERLLALGHPLASQTAWEPCCNRGYMVKPLREYLANVRASDVHRYPDYALDDEPELMDFTLTGATEPKVDWTVGNPPFNLAEAFIRTALAVSRVGCAMLVRGAFTEGERRYEQLFSRLPPAFELKFSERVVMLRGRLIRAGAPDPFNLDEQGNPKAASSATSYVWLVWLHGESDTRARWIAPTRRRLERAGDYPIYPRTVAALGGLFEAVA
jgi:hypothetical protein